MPHLRIIRKETRKWCNLLFSTPPQYAYAAAQYFLTLLQMGLTNEHP
jgi:hypothetical protein